VDHPKAFEEIFIIAFRVLDTTWDEMMASYMDFPKVIAAVKKLVGDAIVTNPSTIDQFARATLWNGPKGIGGGGGPSNAAFAKSDDEDSGNIGTSEPQSIKKLKARIRMDMAEIVKAQKVSFLVQGNWFKIYKLKGKEGKQLGQYLYCKLSENHQELTYGVTNANDTLPAEFLTVKTNECAEVTVGLNSGLFAKQKKLTPQDEEISNLTFSVMMRDQSKPSIDFVAQNREDFLNWTDAFRVLLSDKIENAETMEELKTLENLEVRIRLLELEGLEIPHEMPKVPPIPDNFNFCTA